MRKLVRKQMHCRRGGAANALFTLTLTGHCGFVHGHPDRLRPALPMTPIRVNLSFTMLIICWMS